MICQAHPSTDFIPFLSIGATSATFQLRGTSPVSRLFWNMAARGSSISSASSTSTLEEMPSTPGAFVGSNLCSFCSTLSLVMSMSVNLMLSSSLNLVSGSS